MECLFRLERIYIGYIKGDVNKTLCKAGNKRTVYNLNPLYATSCLKDQVH